MVNSSLDSYSPSSSPSSSSSPSVPLIINKKEAKKWATALARRLVRDDDDKRKSKRMGDSEGNDGAKERILEMNGGSVYNESILNSVIHAAGMLSSVNWDQG